ncbi:amino acid permease [Lactobacillus reuteri]|uniref:amino acid permease n=1 Tax=Limosilactobacillus reuteri TaxID=1598 RepID=UPI00128B3803|nr:amino acid permease [Limosilactobacillus reuteri]MQB81552.1 amino acid permease [Limosilactobacillus reuteri]MQB87912.1 amino acid permease [Limosilactobacillus reuteri]
MTKKTHLAREMSARHIQMIALGGVIGTGLFLSSGYTIHQAGPLGTVIAYLIGALIVYAVMLCLGELSVAMPYTGAFHVYAKNLIGPATGFTVAILYWLTWTIAMGSEFTAAGLIMKRWFPQIPVWWWSLLFIIIILLSNIFTVKAFAESEFWFAVIKVVAICAFILLGALAVIGLIPIQGYHHAPLLNNFTKDGLFPGGFSGLFMTMLTVNFAFSGTELIAITAGETKHPEKTLPKAIHTTLWRLVIFFVGSMIVMASLIPYQKAGVTQSPFVYVFSQLGIPYAADLMNFVVLTAIISAANSGLYASTRILWSLANEGTIPAVIAKTNKRGIPVFALLLSMLGGVLALLSSIYAAGTVYLVLVSVSGLAVVFVWIAISLCELIFRRRFLAAGHQLSELKYRTPWYPIVPWFAFIASSLSCILIWFDPQQRIALYCTIPFVIACYAAYYLQTLWRKYTTKKKVSTVVK